ncbi:unnamed protein product [Rotaria sp. Silwood2]|nr:unnamed protein product [Rotaria sp. Silwood2]CAF4502451.1 unnamed protein product [Rotaria sp. Silwood2]CAF4583830.1 unnamed protein product [Rotaria sp. Silwood2]CAF4811978.1 unnamed protein product [Rotaria sp. Silwood2]
MFYRKSNKEIDEDTTDSESGSESKDYSSDKSYNENECNSDSEEEFVNLFENVSTTSKNWKKGNLYPRLFSFYSSGCGLSSNVRNLTLETPLDFFEFELLFHSNLIEMVVKETNRCHAAPWADTTTNEIYTFLATVMLMPHMKKNRIRDYWSTDHLIATPIFSELFTIDR